MSGRVAEGHDDRPARRRGAWRGPGVALGVTRGVAPPGAWRGPGVAPPPEGLTDRSRA